MPDALLVDQYGNPMTKDGLPVIIPHGASVYDCDCCEGCTDDTWQYATYTLEFPETLELWQSSSFPSEFRRITFTGVDALNGVYVIPRSWSGSPQIFTNPSIAYSRQTYTKVGVCPGVPSGAPAAGVSSGAFLTRTPATCPLLDLGLTVQFLGQPFQLGFQFLAQECLFCQEVAVVADISDWVPPGCGIVADPEEIHGTVETAVAV